MALINMMKPKPKKKAQRDVTAISPPYYEKYPYGLKLDLGTDELNKLGIDVSACRVGDAVYVEAKAEITNISQREELNSTGKMQEEKNICLQITDLNIEKGAGRRVSTTLRLAKSKLGRDDY